jgi:hypothetical protein
LQGKFSGNRIRRYEHVLRMSGETKEVLGHENKRMTSNRRDGNNRLEKMSCRRKEKVTHQSRNI